MVLERDPFSIPELLENILRYLSYYDLQRARLVNSYWHSLIKSSPLLQIQLWKLPDKSENLGGDCGSNWDAMINLLCPSGRSVFLEKYATMKQVLRDDAVNQEIWASYENEESEFRIKAKEFHEAEHRGDVEIATWYCNRCYSMHPGFRYSCIHPVLEGLRHFVCITGDESSLITSICVIGEADCPFLITRLFNLSMYLIHLSKHWQRCKDDMFVRPICTRFIVTSGRGCHVLENKVGVTVGGVVVAFISETVDTLGNLREWDFDLLIDDTLWSGTGTWLEQIDNTLAAMYKEEVQKVREERFDGNYLTLSGDAGEDDYIGKQYALGVLRDYLVEILISIKKNTRIQL